jgi:hypothetical protein
MDGACRKHDMRNAYRIFVENLKGRSRHRWKDNIGWEGVDLIHLAQDTDQWRALVNTVMGFRITQKSGNILTS